MACRRSSRPPCRPGRRRADIRRNAPGRRQAQPGMGRSPELARALYENKPGDKEIGWLDASQHIDLYDQSPYVGQAAEAAAGFLRRKLALRATRRTWPFSGYRLAGGPVLPVVCPAWP